MANKHKKSDAAANQKAAAAYMSKKTTPVQKAQPHKAAPQAEPTEENKVEAASAGVQPAEPMPQQAAQAGPKPVRKSKSKPRAKRKKEPLKLSDLRWDRIFAVVLVFCILVAGVVALVFWLSTRFTVKTEYVPEYRGTNCSASELYEIKEEAAEQSRLAAKMKRKGDVKLFEYYAADELIIPDKGETGWLNLSNAFNNKYVLMATIVDEAGNICARSRGVPAGYTLGEIGVDYMVPYGTHKMHLVVSAYDIKTRKLVGVQYSALTVQIGTEEEMTDG